MLAELAWIVSVLFSTPPPPTTTSLYSLMYDLRRIVSYLAWIFFSSSIQVSSLDSGDDGMLTNKQFLLLLLPVTQSISYPFSPVKSGVRTVH